MLDTDGTIFPAMDCIQFVSLSLFELAKKKDTEFNNKSHRVYRPPYRHLIYKNKRSNSKTKFHTHFQLQRVHIFKMGT